MLININCKRTTITTQRVALGRIDQDCIGNICFTPAGRHGAVKLLHDDGLKAIYEPMGTPLQPSAWIQGSIVTFLY